MSKVQQLEKYAKYLKSVIINSPTHRIYSIGERYQYLEIEKNRKGNIKLLNDIEKCIKKLNNKIVF